MVKETEDPTNTEIADDTTAERARTAGAGVRRVSVTGARMLREALRHGGDDLPAALRGADDGLLLSALDEGLPAERATRVVIELVRRAPERGPELADAVCEKVLLAQLYLDPPPRVQGGVDGPAADPGPCGCGCATR